MPLTPLLMALTAAVLHAAWNSVVKFSDDRLIAVALITTGSLVVHAPIAVATGWPSLAALPFIAVSSVVHVGYIICLAAAYERADLSVAYPIARGVAPILVTLGGIVFLGDEIALFGYIGVACIVAAVASIALLSGHLDGVGWAVLTGLFIATYSLLDAAGVRTGANATEGANFVAWLFVTHGLLSTLLVFGRRGSERVLSSLRENWRSVLLAGAGSGLAYLLVLLASRRAAVGLVSGIRETSVLLGVLIGQRLLHERVTPRHLAAAALAATGGLLIALG